MKERNEILCNPGYLLRFIKILVRVPFFLMTPRPFFVRNYRQLRILHTEFRREENIS